MAALSWLLVRVGPIGIWEAAPEMPELTAAFQAIAIRRMLQTQGSVHARRFGYLFKRNKRNRSSDARPHLIEVHGLRNIRPKQAPLTLEPNEARPWSR